MLIKYKHLWAWDSMIASSLGWKSQQQRLAVEQDAPADAIYQNAAGVWITCRNLSGEVKDQIEAMVGRM